MLRLIPRPLHRILLRLADRLRKGWWRRFGGKTSGVRILALDDAGRVLLVRHSYGSGQWMPPSGGLSAGEDACAAAARELREETGAGLAHAVQLDALSERLSGATDSVHLIAGRLTGTPRADMREIVALGLFAPDALPAPMSLRMAAELPAWVDAAALLLAAPPETG